MIVGPKSVRFLFVGSFSGMIACGQSMLWGTESASSSQVELGVHAAQPSSGRPGDVVVVTGQGFRERMTVSFDQEQSEVEWLGSEALLVTVPPSKAEGLVDVIVVAGNQSARLVDGFTFLPNNGAETLPSGSTTGTTGGGSTVGETGLLDTGDTGESDTATGTPWTGSMGDTAGYLPSGVVQMQHLQVSCPSCLGLTSDLLVTAEAAFHEPVSDGWLDWLPALGTCTLNPPNDPLVSSYIDVGEWVSLTSGTSTQRLDREVDASGARYTVAGLGTDEFLRTAFFDLTVPDGGDYGAWSVSDAVLTPTGFSDIQPWELLLVSPLDAFSARLSKSGTDLTWSPTGTGTFLLMVDVYSPAGLPTGDLVVCQSADSGGMTLPGGYFSAHPAGSLLVVYLIRNQHVLTPLGGDSWLEGVAQMGVIGTAVLVP